MLTGAQLTQLNTELRSDPRVYGYAAFVPIALGGSGASADWNGLTARVNLPRTGANGGPAITIRRDDIVLADIYAAIAVADYTALGGSPTAAQLSQERRYLSWLTGLSALERVRLLDDAGADTPVIANFRAMFGAGTATMIRLVALANRFGSRAEELFGRNVVATDGEVETAWRLT